MRRGGRRLRSGPLGFAGFSGGAGGRGRLLALWALTLTGFLIGCSGEPGSEAPPDPHADLRQRLGVEPGREIHQVTIGGRGDEEHVVPPLLRVPADALVVFVTVDGRVHTVSFAEDSLDLEAALFLERTSQMRSPPLVDRGSRFVITLEGAPRGRYRFRSRGPGGDAWGTLVVGDSVGTP